MIVRATGEPTPDEVRAVLSRIAASDMLRHSPQLCAFLRFIVETTLRGEGDRLKGYTIATEALGRGEDFNPEADPIVRVEAGRLRRAIEQYSAGPGAKDEVVIDVPRGSYVPTFRRRADQTVPVPPGLRRGLVHYIPRTGWVSLVAAAFVLIGTTVLVAIGRWERSTERAPTASVPTDQQLIGAFRADNGFPVVFVQPFDTIGTPAVSRITPDGLRRRLNEALARFDEITVASTAVTLAGADDHTSLTAERPLPSKYQAGATAEYSDNGMVALTFTLVDTNDSNIVWVRTFDRTQFALDSGADEERIVQEVATTLARTFGIIHSRERAKPNNDPRYSCVLKMLDYLHGLDAGNYAQARACLERVTKLDPNFAMGFAWLSWIYIREHQYEGFGGSSDPPAVDRALKAAQRAVSLKPQSARAHEALLGAYFARGEFAAAFAEADRALSLNPFDPAIRTVYGIRLIAVGQYDRGAALLKDSSADSVQRPTWLNSYLFLAAYLKGDLATATQYANLDTSETYPLNVVARTLSAAGNGDRDQARQMIERLDKLYPAFRDHPRRELGKFIPSKEIVEHLTHDLAAARLRATN
jgi:tetratricopeptide (TPR) repeat protein